jgi:AmmeMemoRadiSam system protein A
MIDREQQRVLLALARQSIEHGLQHGCALTVDAAASYSETLRARQACFVTLHKDGNLRGCIGSLEARRPLVEDVAANAFAAAFRDPRFSPLARHELAAVHIDISVLSPPRPLQCESEQDLINRLRPGVDGLILEAGTHRATFLPSVWEQLPEPHEFLDHLKMKAGLGRHEWPPDIHFQRYTSEFFAE